MSTKIKFDRHSIKFRLWMYFIGIGVGILLLVWFLQIFFLNNYYEHMKTTEVNRVASSIYHAYARGDAGLTEAIQDLSISNDFYVMMESGGKVLLFMPEAESLVPVYQYKDQIPKLRGMLQEAPAKTTAVSFKINTGLEKYNTLAYATYLSRTKNQEVFLYIFSPLYPVTSTVEILKDQLFYVTIITLCVTFLLAVYFADRISKPLKGITQTARKMGKGNYNVRFEANSYSEINNLAKALNVAAYELGQADNRQKDLVANVSHDLKTPLTMIRSYAEMIRDLSGDNPQKRNAHLAVIIDESDRMSRLVSDMATITAMQTKKMKLHKTPTDLSSTAASILASYEILQEREGYDFIFNAPKEAFVYADEDHRESHRQRGQILRGRQGDPRDDPQDRQGLSSGGFRPWSRHQAGGAAACLGSLLQNEHELCPGNDRYRSRPLHCQGDPHPARRQLRCRKQGWQGQYLLV